MRNSLRTLVLLLVLLLSVLPAISTPHVAAQVQEANLLDPIQSGDVYISLEPIATGLTAPNWGTYAPGDGQRLFVTDQAGILWVIDLNTREKSVFLDVGDRLVPLGIGGTSVTGSFDERGLLGVAFHPDYATNGLLYTYTSEPVSGPADFSTIPAGEEANHQSVIVEWKVPSPADSKSVVDPTSARVILRIDQPQFNHDGGALNFGDDGKLYISLGDGGNGDDEGIGHGEKGNGQDPSTVLGSILRIDPLGSGSANEQYGVPNDNPFTGQAGFVGEIYAYGFRNPFRFSFDMAAGDLYVGDVGQGHIEEVDVVVSGGNYGWNLKEGSFCFDPNGTDPGFAFDQEPCPRVPNGLTLTDPIAQYNSNGQSDNDDGAAVVGGFVYRGSAIEELAGLYVFGDYSHTFPSSFSDGRLFYLEPPILGGTGVKGASDILEFRLTDREKLGRAVLGFGQDADGELYVLGNETGIPFGETGVVLKIVKAHFRNFLPLVSRN